MNFLKQLTGQLRSGISRYIVAFYGSCILFLLTAFFIYAEPDENLMIRLILSVFFAVIVSILSQLLSLHFGLNHTGDLIQKILSASAAVPCFFLLKNIQSSYTVLGYGGITAAVAVCALYLLFTDGNQNSVIPYLIKNLFFAVFIGLLFSGGVVLCIYAVNYLIYEFADVEKYIITIFAFAYQILALNVFLSGLPRMDEELHIPKAFKILVLYVAFPIYLLLLAVLYVYLGKILITMNMPGGQINLFASFASLFFIFFRFTIVQFDYKITRYFTRFGGYLMIPILAAQYIAVYIRLSAYGITSARYASVVLTFIALIFIIASLIRKGRYLRHVLLIAAGVVFLVSVTPLNIIDVPVYNQTMRLERVLEKNNMLSGDRITPAADISDRDKADIRSSYNYLIYQQKVPSYLKGDMTFKDLFGFDQDVYSRDDIRYFSHFGKQSSEFDISGYNRLIEINEAGRISNGRFIVSVENTDYDLTDFILAVSENSSPENTDDRVIKYNLTDRILLYFKTIDCGIKSDHTFEYYSFTGFALIK